MCSTMGFGARLRVGDPFTAVAVTAAATAGESAAGMGGAGEAERGVMDATGVPGGMGVLFGSAMVLAASQLLSRTGAAVEKDASPSKKKGRKPGSGPASM